MYKIVLFKSLKKVKTHLMSKNKLYSSDNEMFTIFIGIRNSS